MPIFKEISPLPANHYEASYSVKTKQSFEFEGPFEPQSEFENLFVDSHTQSHLFGLLDSRSLLELGATCKFFSKLINSRKLEFQLLPAAQGWHSALNANKDKIERHSAGVDASTFLGNCFPQGINGFTIKVIELDDMDLWGTYGLWELIICLQLLIMKDPEIYGHLVIIFHRINPTPYDSKVSIVLSNVVFLAQKDNCFLKMIQDHSISLNEMRLKISLTCSDWLIRLCLSHSGPGDRIYPESYILLFAPQKAKYKISLALTLDKPLTYVELGHPNGEDFNGPNVLRCRASKLFLIANRGRMFIQPLLAEFLQDSNCWGKAMWLERIPEIDQ